MRLCDEDTRRSLIQCIPMMLLQWWYFNCLVIVRSVLNPTRNEVQIGWDWICIMLFLGGVNWRPGRGPFAATFHCIRVWPFRKILLLKILIPWWLSRWNPKKVCCKLWQASWNSTINSSVKTFHAYSASTIRLNGWPDVFNTACILRVDAEEQAWCVEGEVTVIQYFYAHSEKSFFLASSKKSVLFHNFWPEETTPKEGWALDTYGVILGQNDLFAGVTHRIA